MAIVSWTIRQKIGIGEISGDAEFPNAYHAALRARRERKLPFGRRRLDKHDRWPRAAFTGKASQIQLFDV